MGQLFLLSFGLTAAGITAAWLMEQKRRRAFPLPPVPARALGSFGTVRPDPLGLSSANIGVLLLVLLGGGVLAVVAGVATLSFAVRGNDSGRYLGPVMITTLLATVVAAWMVVRRRGRVPAPRVPGPAIRLFSDRLELPEANWNHALEPKTHALASVQGLQLRADALVIDMALGARVVPRAILAEPADLERLAETLQQALDALPGAEEIQARSARHRAAAEVFQVRPAAATAALRGLLIAVFVVEAVCGLYSNELATLRRLGAMVGAEVWRGRLEQLFSAGYLHAGVVHLWLNLGFIAAFGTLLERLLGPWRLLLVVLVSGPAGMFTASLHDPVCVGASAWAFGLCGAMGAVEYRHADRLPPGFRLRLESWMALALPNAALPLLFPRVSWAAHLGGLLAGAVVARLAAWREDALEAQPEMPVRALVALLVLVHLGAFAMVGARAR